MAQMMGTCVVCPDRLVCCGALEIQESQQVDAGSSLALWRPCFRTACKWLSDAWKCAILTWRGQPEQPEAGQSSRLEEFTTTRNEAEKLKALWAAEKKQVPAT